MSVMKKRRRTQMKDFHGADNLLISEYRKRTAFYDRNHLQYRKREYIEPLWLDLAHAVGQNVSIAKNRIMQLKNRYNLEKRRVESEQSHNGAPLTSQWPMYEALSFLGEHIKPRGRLTNGRSIQDIKASPLEYSSSESNSYQGANSSKRTKTPMPTRGIRQLAEVDRSTNCLQVTSPTIHSTLSRPLVHTMNAVAVHGRAPTVDAAAAAPPVTLPGPPTASVKKFHAFGQFLANSLIEMDERDALRLVEKFTSEIVQTMLNKLKAHHSVDFSQNMVTI